MYLFKQIIVACLETDISISVIVRSWQNSHVGLHENGVTDFPR